jgi:hypothetical protein
LDRASDFESEGWAFESLWDRHFLFRKGESMSILARFSPPSMTADQYDAILARLYKEGIQPADGLELEVCFGSGDQMKVSLLFDSMDAFEKFGERLQPVLQELGMDPGTPDIMNVHHVIRRGT